MRAVWIVGASRGLGLELASVFARRGWRVVGMARHAPVDTSTFQAFHRVDVTDADGFEARVCAAYQEGPGPALIVYVAARIYQGPLLEQPLAAAQAELDANYLGFLRLCQAVATHKPRGETVRLVATGSTVAYVGCPSLDNYSASKAALLSLVRSARTEFRSHGITTHFLSPPHMDNDSADLVGPRMFSLAWSADRFARACERGTAEYLLGASNRLVLLIARLSPRLAQWMMDRIGGNALRRGARRTSA